MTTLVDLIARDTHCGFERPSQRQLPNKWTALNIDKRMDVVRYLCGKAELQWFWLNMPKTDRKDVVLHIRHAFLKRGMAMPPDVPNDGLYRTIAGSIATHRRFSNAQARTEWVDPYETPQVSIINNVTNKSTTKAIDEVTRTNDVYKKLPFGPYTPPNGGKRIVASAYTRLTTVWITAAGVVMRPCDMDSTHLSNSIALLEESHRNLLEKLNRGLEKLHAHAQNLPEARDGFVQANRAFQNSSVEEVYPIIKVMRAEMARRGRAPAIGDDVDVDMGDESWVD